MSASQNQLNWSYVLDKVDEAVAAFTAQNVKPTLRTLFYWLVSKQTIPNTESSYKTLSRKVVEARKQGRWAWDFLEDKTRTVVGGLADYRYSDYSLEWFKERLQEKLDSLDVDRMLNDFFDYLMPSFEVQRWAEQDEVCEVWLEKEALASTIHAWVSDLEVPLRINRGYSSWTFIYNNVQELNLSLSKHKKVTILYLGDLDPSGVDIQRFLTEAIRYFGLQEDKIELVRLAITPKQVEEFKLPPRPEDAQTLAKLARDVRSKKYTLSYVIELDALVAYAPSEFKELLRKAIIEKWDKSKFDELKEKAAKCREQALQILDEVKRKAKKKLIDNLRL